MQWAEPIVRRAAWAVIFGIIIAFLALARPVFVPISLAILLSFLLTPIVDRLENWLRSRTAAVIVTCTVSAAVVAGAGFVIGMQMYDFADNLPGYRTTITHKIQSIHANGEGVIGRAMSAVSAIQHDVAAPATQAAAEAQQPMPVTVVGSGDTNPALYSALGIIGPIGEVLALFGFVILLVIMLLLYGPDLRDRIIVLAGTQSISVTTQALEEASSRISRYLLFQAIINTFFGLVIGIGLFFIGVPNAALLGFLAGMLRFIPVIGPWLGATLPLLLAFAVSKGWAPTLEVVGLFAVTEIFINTAVEPWLYGSSTGLSGVAVVGAILFWTWIWGSVGLLLAIPITVCLVVLGKYVEPLRIFFILLGDEPVLAGERRLYHRIIGGDLVEAEEIVTTAVKEHGEARACDELLLPVLRTARSDFDRGLLSDQRFAVINETIESISDDLAGDIKGTTSTIACIGLDPADHTSVRVVSNTLKRSCDQPVAELGQTLLSDIVQRITDESLAVLVIVASTPESLARARLLAKGLCRRLPAFKTLIVDLANISGTFAGDPAGLGVAIYKTVESLVERLEQYHRERVSVTAETEPPAPISACDVPAIATGGPASVGA